MLSRACRALRRGPLASASRVVTSTRWARPLARCLSDAAGNSPHAHGEEGFDLASRIIRFADNEGEQHFGVFEDAEEKSARIVRRAGAKTVLTDKVVDIGSILAPVEPPVIYAVGLNYKAHAEEAGLDLPVLPVVFIKATSSVVGHQDAIIIPACARNPPEVDYEAELAVIIGRECRNVPKEMALDFVLGYTIANDVGARRWQGRKGGGQWSRAKSFDTFCPLGPFLVPKSRVPDPQDLRITLRLNGEVMQDASTKDMVFTVAEIVSFLSQGTTLHPGTVILTGTPAGVGYVRKPPRYLSKGDIVEVEIEKLGKLVNVVAEEEDWGAISFA